MKGKAAILGSLLVFFFLLGCAAQFQQQISLSSPVDYDHAFQAALNAAVDVGLSHSKANKEAGTLTFHAFKAAGYAGAYGIEVFIDRGAEGVRRIVLRGDSMGGIMPHTKSKVEEFVDEYARALRKRLQ